MNILRPSFRRAQNAGDMPLFRKMQGQVTEISKQIYGEKHVGAVRYGRVGGTAYILIDLLSEPDGAKGPASDHIFSLNANLYSVLKASLASEAAVLDACPAELGAARNGRNLLDLFEFQVNHPISGRLLVAPLERQRAFRAS